MGVFLQKIYAAYLAKFEYIMNAQALRESAPNPTLSSVTSLPKKVEEKPPGEFMSLLIEASHDMEVEDKKDDKIYGGLNVNLLNQIATYPRPTKEQYGILH